MFAFLFEIFLLGLAFYAGWKLNTWFHSLPAKYSALGAVNGIKAWIQDLIK